VEEIGRRAPLRPKNLRQWTRQGNPVLSQEALVISSGSVVVDFLNYGHHASLSFSQASSQAAMSVLIYGETAR
jgi:hypothetical protein